MPQDVITHVLTWHGKHTKALSFNSFLLVPLARKAAWGLQPFFSGDQFGLLAAAILVALGGGPCNKAGAPALCACADGCFVPSLTVRGLMHGLVRDSCPC